MLPTSWHSGTNLGDPSGRASFSRSGNSVWLKALMRPDPGLPCLKSAGPHPRLHPPIRTAGSTRVVIIRLLRSAALAAVSATGAGHDRSDVGQRHRLRTTPASLNRVWKSGASSCVPSALVAGRPVSAFRGRAYAAAERQCGDPLYPSSARRTLAGRAFPRARGLRVDLQARTKFPSPDCVALDGDRPVTDGLPNWIANDSARQFTTNRPQHWRPRYARLVSQASNALPKTIPTMRPRASGRNGQLLRADDQQRPSMRHPPAGGTEPRDGVRSRRTLQLQNPSTPLPIDTERRHGVASPSVSFWYCIAGPTRDPQPECLTPQRLSAPPRLANGAPSNRGRSPITAGSTILFVAFDLCLPLAAPPAPKPHYGSGARPIPWPDRSSDRDSNPMLEGGWGRHASASSGNYITTGRAGADVFAAKGP